MVDHDEMRAAMRRAMCGTYSGYVTGCRCADCTRANTVYNRDYKMRKRKGLVNTTKPVECLPGNLSIQPLLEMYPDVDDKTLATICGVNREAVSRWRRRGLSLAVADRVAIGLGKHPYELWGRAYWGAK